MCGAVTIFAWMFWAGLEVVTNSCQHQGVGFLSCRSWWIKASFLEREGCCVLGGELQPLIASLKLCWLKFPHWVYSSSHIIRSSGPVLSFKQACNYCQCIELIHLNGHTRFDMSESESSGVRSAKITHR